MLRVIALSEAIWTLRIFAGVGAATSTIMGVSIFLSDVVEPVIQILGLTVAAGQAPISAYLLAAIFEDSQQNTGTEGDTDN